MIPMAGWLFGNCNPRQLSLPPPKPEETPKADPTPAPVESPASVPSHTPPPPSSYSGYVNPNYGSCELCGGRMYSNSYSGLTRHTDVVVEKKTVLTIVIVTNQEAKICYACFENVLRDAAREVSNYDPRLIRIKPGSGSYIRCWGRR